MSVGRKKIFNEENALSAALDLFWQKGYVGTSLSDLTAKMGINKPSMYNTFGNKEDLFIKTLELYAKNTGEFISETLDNSSLRLCKRIENLMHAVVNWQTESIEHKGCLLVLTHSESAGGEVPEKASGQIREMNDFLRKKLEDIFTNDEESIKLGLNKNAEGHALSITNTLNGTSCLTRADFTKDQLKDVIDNCLRGIFGVLI